MTHTTSPSTAHRLPTPADRARLEAACCAVYPSLHTDYVCTSDADHAPGDHHYVDGMHLRGLDATGRPVYDRR